MMPKLPLLAACGLCALSVAALRADPTSVGPFTGTNSETFEEFTNFVDAGDAYLPEGTLILNGTATLGSTNQDMVIYTASGDTPFFLGYADAQTSDGNQGVGLNSPGDSFTIDFANPVSALGAYFGAGYYPDLQFFGNLTFSLTEQGNATPFQSTYDYTATDGSLVWQGWAADPGTGFTSVTVSGDYVVMDGVQTAPDRATTALLLAFAAGALLVVRRRALA